MNLLNPENYKSEILANFQNYYKREINIINIQNSNLMSFDSFVLLNKDFK